MGVGRFVLRKVSLPGAGWGLVLVSDGGRVWVVGLCCGGLCEMACWRMGWQGFLVMGWMGGLGWDAVDQGGYVRRWGR